MHKKISSLFLSFALIATGIPVWGLGPQDITAESAVLIDQESGRILLEKNPDEILYPASTTKVLTALIILQDCKLSDIVTVDATTPFVEGARIYLFEGEKITVEQLLYALMLSSANDAAIALAKYHSGTIEKFAAVMNQKAKEIGVTHTHFTNPNGLPDPNHVTTAKDMALISRKAMENPKFREIVSTVAYAIAPTNKQSEIRHLTNANRMLRGGTGWHNWMDINGKKVEIKWDLADGIKTGYTDAARQCLMSSASKNGRRVIASVLKAEGQNMYKDSRQMLEYGLNDFTYLNVVKINQSVGSLTLQTKPSLKIPVEASKQLSIPLKSGEESRLDKKLVANSGLVFPIKKGQVVGQLQYSINAQIVGSVPILSAKDIYDTTPSGVFNGFLFLAKWVGIILSLPLLILGAWKLWDFNGRKKRLKRRHQLRSTFYSEE